MATLTIRNVDPQTHEQLRVRAAHHGRSMEAELRQILKDAVGAEAESLQNDESGLSLVEAIRRRFAPFGGVDDLVPHPRVMAGEPPKFKE